MNAISTLIYWSFSHSFLLETLFIPTEPNKEAGRRPAFEEGKLDLWKITRSISRPNIRRSLHCFSKKTSTNTQTFTAQKSVTKCKVTKIGSYHR